MRRCYFILMASVCYLWSTLAPRPSIAQQTSDPTQGLQLSGHLSDVTAAEFTPDGRYVITTSTDETARLWDAKTGETVRIYRGHQGPLYCLAISADGNLLATGAQDNSLRLWDVPRNASLKTLTLHQGAAEHFVISPDSLSAVSVGRDQGVQFITLASGQVAPRVGHSAPALRAAYRSDNSLFATADDAGHVFIWSPYLDSPQGKLGAHSGAVTGLAFHPNNQQLLTTGADGTFRLWQLPAAQRVFAGSSDALRCLVVVNTQVAVTAGADRVIRVIDYNTMQPLRELTGHEAPILSLAVSPNQALVASGDAAGNIRVWQLGDGALLSQTPAHSGAVQSLAFHPDNQRLLSAGADGLVRLWQTGAMLTAGLELPQAHAGGVTSALFSPNAEQILTAGADNAVRLWNVADAASVRTFSGHSGAVTCAVFSPDGSRIFSGSVDKTVRVWNAADASPMAIWQQPAAVHAITVTNDTLRAAVACEDHRVHLWDIASGQEWEWFDGHSAPVLNVRFSPDNRTVISVSADKTLRVCQSSIVRVTTLHDGGVHEIALLTGGGQAVTSGADGQIKMWDVGSGQLVREFTGAAGTDHALAIRPDNQRLAAGGEDGTVHVWNLSNGEHLFEVQLGAPVRCLAYSPDNQKLAASNDRGELFVFGPATPPMNMELIEHQRLTLPSVLTRLAFHAESRWIYSSDAAGNLEQWAYASPVPVRQLNHGGPVFGTVISNDGSMVASCSADQTVRIFEVKTGGQRAQMNGHQGAVYGLAVTRDGALLISSGSDNSLRLWDVLGGRPLKQLATTEATMYGVAVHPTAALIVAGGGDRKVHLFDLLSGNLQRTLEGHADFVQSVAFNPQGTRILSYGYAGNLTIWNAADGAVLYKTRIGRVGNTARYNFDGTRVVVANGDGLARVIDLPPQAQ